MCIRDRAVPTTVCGQVFGLAQAGIITVQGAAIVLAGSAGQYVAPAFVVAGAGGLGRSGCCTARRVPQSRGRESVGRVGGSGPLDAAHGGAPFGSRTARTGRRLRPTGRCAWRCSLRLADGPDGSAAQAHWTLRMAVLPSARGRPGRVGGSGPLDAAHGGAPFVSRPARTGRRLRPAGRCAWRCSRGLADGREGSAAQAHWTLRMAVLPSARGRPGRVGGSGPLDAAHGGAPFGSLPIAITIRNDHSTKGETRAQWRVERQSCGADLSLIHISEPT